MKKLIHEATFKKATVKVYENRIEIQHAAKLSVLATKGITGKLTISLKHLTGVNLTPMHIVLAVPGMAYTQEEIKKMHADNAIDFDPKKEREIAEQLVAVIEDLL